MMTIVPATIATGCGVATKNIRHQLPHLAAQFPDIKNIYSGSINVTLDAPMPTLSWDYTTSLIRWWDADPITGGGSWAFEHFSLLEFKFEYPLNAPLHRAWLFDCHNSRYHNDPFRFEIIAEWIAAVATGQRCKLHLEKMKVVRGAS
jgi:hypothetical protein